MFTVFFPLMFLSGLFGSGAEAAPEDQTARSLFEVQATRGARWVPHRYLVRPHMGRRAALDDAVTGASCWIDRWAQNETIAIVACPHSQHDAVWIETLSILPEVAWVDANYLITLNNVPNDLTTQQWHLKNTGQKIRSEYGLARADISAPEAWAVTTGSSEVIVAVLDTGLYLEHADLQSNIWSPPGEICYNGVDDDGNGYIDDCLGWDFGNGDADVSPSTITGGDCTPAHGTFISGLIGADTDNDLGIAGLNWTVQVMPLKIAQDDTCSISAESLLDSLVYAQNNGAHILNASFQFTEYIEAIDNAFKALSDASILVTIASGNQGRHVDTLTTYPIDFHHSGTLVVAASDHKDTAASFTNYGPEVDLFAPGKNLRSTGVDHPDEYIWGSGTSFASPLVAATAALLLAEHPTLNTSQIRKAITLGTDPIDAFDCTKEPVCVGSGGRLNAEQALLFADSFVSSGVPVLEAVYFTDRVGDAIGDGDGRLERGEVAYITLATSNLGRMATPELSARVQVSHPYVQMGRMDTRIPSVSAGETAVSDATVSISVSKDCLEDQSARVTVSYTHEASGETWTDYQWVPIYCVIDDDNDGHLYPDDCNDLDPEIHPKSVESCNGYDDNCDGLIDGLGASGSVVLFQDADGDGDGNPAVSGAGCADTMGWSTSNTDCDDTNPNTYLGADERCDTLDNDCDTLVDEDAIDRPVWYQDNDGDGLGNPKRTTLSCEQPPHHVANNEDCDEGNTRICERSGACNSGGTPLSMFWWMAICLWIVVCRLRMHQTCSM